jgi:hypothetical protein
VLLHRPTLSALAAHITDPATVADTARRTAALIRGNSPGQGPEWFGRMAATCAAQTRILAGAPALDSGPEYTVAHAIAAYANAAAAFAAAARAGDTEAATQAADYAAALLDQAAALFT